MGNQGGGGMSNLGNLGNMGGAGSLGNMGGPGGHGNMGNLSGLTGLGGLGNLMGSNAADISGMGNLSSLMGMGGAGGGGPSNMTDFPGNNVNNPADMSGMQNGMFGQNNNMMGTFAMQNSMQNNFNQERNKDTNTCAVDPSYKGNGPNDAAEQNVNGDGKEESDISDFDEDDDDIKEPDEWSKQQNQGSLQQNQSQGMSALQQLQNSASNLRPSVDNRNLSSFLPNSQMNHLSNLGNMDMSNSFGRRGSMSNNQSLNMNDLNSLARLQQLRGGLSPTSAFETTHHGKGDSNLRDMSALARLQQQLGGGGSGTFNPSQQFADQLGQQSQLGSVNLGDMDSLTMLQQQLKASGGVDNSQSLSNQFSQRGLQGTNNSGNMNSMALIQQQLPNQTGRRGLSGSGLDLSSLELLRKHMGGTGGNTGGMNNTFSGEAGKNTSDLTTLARLQQLQGMNPNMSLGGTGNSESNQPLSNEGASMLSAESGPLARLQQLQQMTGNNSTGSVGGQASASSANNQTGGNDPNEMHSLARLQQLQQLTRNNSSFGGGNLGQQLSTGNDSNQTNNGDNMNDMGALARFQQLGQVGANNFSSNSNANDQSAGATAQSFPNGMSTFSQLQQQLQGAGTGSDLSSKLTEQPGQTNNSSGGMNNISQGALELLLQFQNTSAGDSLGLGNQLGLSNDGSNNTNPSAVLQEQLRRASGMADSSQKSTDQQVNQGGMLSDLSGVESQGNNPMYEKMLQQMGIDVTPKRETPSQGSPSLSSSLPGGDLSGQSLRQQMQSTGTNHLLLQQLLARSSNNNNNTDNNSDSAKDDDAKADV
mgnify:CR=1 FL=1